MGGGGINSKHHSTIQNIFIIIHSYTFVIIGTQFNNLLLSCACGKTLNKEAALNSEEGEEKIWLLIS